MVICENHAILLRGEDCPYCRIAELEELVDNHEEYSICDCCHCLTSEPVDCGGHVQCKSCTRIAELKAQIKLIREGENKVITALSLERDALKAENERLREAVTALKIQNILAEMDADDGWALVPRHRLEDLQKALLEDK